MSCEMFGNQKDFIISFLEMERSQYSPSLQEKATAEEVYNRIVQAIKDGPKCDKIKINEISNLGLELSSIIVCPDPSYWDWANGIIEINIGVFWPNFSIEPKRRRYRVEYL